MIKRDTGLGWAGCVTTTLLCLGAVKANAYSFEVSDTTAQIYGFVKLDAIYDFDDALGNSIDRKKIRTGDTRGSDGHTNLHAYQSRIGFSTATPAGDSVLKTTIEGDFLGGGGGSFRLRHAFGEWNGILAGQTWTNFGGFIGPTPVIDAGVHPGHALRHRQAQVRYTRKRVSIAAEDPDDRGGRVYSDHAKSKLPDVTVRYTEDEGGFRYGASALLRYLEYDDYELSNNDTALGWGLNLEAALDVTTNLTLRAAAVYGEGVGGYMQQSPFANPGYIDNDGHLQAIKTIGGTAGASLNVGPGAINLVYGIATVDLDAGVADGVIPTDADEKFTGTYVNYIWSPVRNVTYGLELGLHNRRQVNGDSGDATRFQGMIRYSF